jgi:hypothetical protein
MLKEVSDLRHLAASVIQTARAIVCTVKGPIDEEWGAPGQRTIYHCVKRLEGRPGARR